MPHDTWYHLTLSWWVPAHIYAFQADWTDYTGALLSSMWVTAVPHCVLSLLIMPVLGSSECEWLLCLTVFQACWQCLFFALQDVSNCCALLGFKPTDNASPEHFSKWVAAMLCCVSSILTMPICGSSVCEWLLCFAVFQAYWQYLSVILKSVSGDHAIMHFKPVDNANLWLFRMWVASALHQISG